MDTIGRFSIFIDFSNLYRTAMSGHMARIKQEISDCETNLSTKSDRITVRLTLVEGN